MFFPSGRPWLRQHAPLILGVLLLFTMCLSLGWQTVGWINLLRAPAEPLAAQPQAAQQSPLLDRLKPLFGPPPTEGQVSASTNLNLVLLGSFIHSDPTKSSAIIQSAGQTPKRFLNGSNLDDTTRIHAIYRDHVELERNGRLERLAFSPSRVSTSNTDMNEPEESEDEQLQRHMEALREQMEKAGEQELLPPEQPTESD